MNKLRKKIFYIIFLILTGSILSFIIIFNTQKYIEQKKSIEDNLEKASNNEKEKNIPENNSKENIYKNSIDKPSTETNQIDSNSQVNEATSQDKKTQTDQKNQQDNIIDSKSDEEKNMTKHNQDNKQNDTSTENKGESISTKQDIKYMDKVIYTVLLDENNNIKDIINMTNNDIDENKIKSLAQKILSSKNLKEKKMNLIYIEKYSYIYNKGKYLIILDTSQIRSSLITSIYISLILLIILEIIIYIISKKITNWIIQPVEVSFEKQKQFIEDASHELKTPLSVIVASSEALYKYPNEKKWLTNIKNEANRMNILVQNLLELATSEKKEMYKITEGNLSKIVELSVLTFEGKSFEEEIKLNYRIKENINALFDEDSIKQLIEILLDNAIKHADKKSTINVYLNSINNQIELIIENKGEEIPKGDEEKIFERFYRVDKSRNRKENRYGLGLAIAKNIVTNHNGTITAKSSNNITTFKIVLKNNNI